MIDIVSRVPLGQLMRDLHRLGAEAMVLIVALHMLRTFLTGSYKKPRQFTWFTGVLLLIFTGFLSFTGYLLPWDQLALWAVTIGASMIEATPPQVVGENLNLLVRGGPEIAANGLLRFYLAHVLLLPVLLFIFVGVHYYKVIIHGHSLPPKKENIGEDTAKRVPLDKRVYYIPDILTNELMWIAVTTLILVVLCIWFYDAPLEHHADPQVTPLGTTAPWYFLWLQGALKLGDKVFWGLIFPGILLGVLLVWPYLDVTPSRRFADNRIQITIFMLLISFVTLLSYMGLAKFGVATSADNEVLHELTFPPAHNHMGELLPVPYDQLVVGMYTTREIEAEQADPNNGSSAVAAFNEEVETFTVPNADGTSTQTIDVWVTDLLNREDHLPITGLNFATVPADAPELKQVMEDFQHMLELESQELYNGWGAVIVSQNQASLKRIDVVLVWDEVQLEAGLPVLDANGNVIPVLDEATGQPKRRLNRTHIFIHEDGAYFAN
jgi:ubiquinol-cytochrome c reductase cytochrome b subunit